MLKLDQADYENIFLRVREKLLIHIFAIFSFLLAIIGISTWFVAKTKIETITENAVNNYVRSENFKKTIVNSYQQKLAWLDERTNELEKSLSKKQIDALQLSEIPIIIGENNLSIVNKAGEVFSIEMGKATSGERITFNKKFKSEPMVFLTLDSSNIESLTVYRIQKKGFSSIISKCDTNGFEVPPSSDFYPLKYKWVAFGTQEIDL
jgi:hypothetical protein